ncbi:MAG: hypothetical protein RIQ54_230 [Candidatus Parcubacteria bacterium]|jgi:predicted Zn-dependent peptidase
MIDRIVLKNGLRIVLVPQPKSPTATALVLVEAGSEYESKPTNGISHFLEHLVFKGTTKRPRAGMIATELDGLGASYNAFTAQEYTGYWAKAQSHKIDHVLELVSDLYLHPLIDEHEMDKERGVIIEELHMYEDTPMRKIGDYFMELLYGDQPAGWDIGGTVSNIRAITRQQVIDYRTAHYVPAKTAVVVSGDFSKKRIISAVEKSFGLLPRRPIIRKTPTVLRQQKSRVYIKHKESDQSHIMLGVPAFDMHDRRRYPLEVLSALLGSGMSSRLFHRIREQMGAAYYVRSGADLFIDHGFFAISAGVDHAKIDAVIGAILDECSRVIRESISSAELRKTKDHLIGTFMLSLETSDELGSFYGFQEIARKKLIDPDGVIAKIEAVTSAHVRSVARDIFLPERLHMAVVGPYQDVDHFSSLLRFP